MPRTTGERSGPFAELLFSAVAGLGLGAVAGSVLGGFVWVLVGQPLGEDNAWYILFVGGGAVVGGLGCAIGLPLLGRRSRRRRGQDRTASV